ncbi:patatin-like phospholipase family protein [Variovorax sp. dw_954]|uniref:patatin-like phospholipase family protein n=1 Tax=Variovorax sp. dw_954 TaxID=2720078 RepID=UPI001BD5B8C4|nr:patatin-like phospholipase family protein [Variovorax sp. dw_954]
MDETLRELVKTRREALNGADDGRRAWGLALSGGGIRSATFCLGLIKSLAAHRQLLKFDIVSTVSGGGYIGATLGRLCTDAKSADEVREIERAFADVDRARFGWWLRANGRYLIPGGMRDTLFAAALYLRNLLGTHIELAIAACLVGMALAASNLLMWDAVFRAVDLNNTQPTTAQATIGLLVKAATQLPTLWFAAAGPFIASIVLSCAYWSVRDKPSLKFLLVQVGMWCVLSIGACILGPMLVIYAGGPDWLSAAFVGFALCWVIALTWVVYRSRHRTAAQQRNELTDALAAVLNTTLLIGVLGLLDRSAWWLAAENQQMRASYGATLLVVAAILRAVLPVILSQKQQTPGLEKSMLAALASVLGLVLAFCLAAWWIGVVYAATLLQVFQPEGLEFWRGWAWLAAMFVVLGAYATLTGSNFAFLNISSLHMFYKARIVRGYLGAANARRLGASPTDQVSGLMPPQVPVGEVDGQDDISQLKYAPHQYGGPVHLANVCINQTHDPKQKLFNRDRKSLPMTIGPLGWMQAGGSEWAKAHGDGAMTLGAWTAISGAAFAPGFGRLTKRGIAALTVFAGLRLGYWWNSAEAGILQRGAAVRGTKLLTKTRFLLLECFGAFPGSSSANWYLSDGGHFENTGAYALLRQEAALIVIADCGADPDYRFCDLEILIRRARIDLNAEITFMKPRPGASLPQLEAFGSLNDLASPSSQACLALAQVRYTSGATGQIILVKPNVSAALPVDLVNFKAANPAFPQQPTTDQFFDEAQWESYFRLGAQIGTRLDGELLDMVADGAPGLFMPDDGQAAQAAGTRAAADGAPPAGTAGTMATTASRLQARVLRAGAVTATVGLGTAATIGVAAWQGIDSWRAQLADAEKSENAAFKDLSQLWARLKNGVGTSGDAPASLAAELLRTGDLLCRDGGDNFMAKFRLSVRIVDDAKAACTREPVEQRTPACARLLDPANGIDCLQPAQAPPCAPRYWARDYTGLTPPSQNCSGTLPTPWPMVVWLNEMLTGAAPSVAVATGPAPKAGTPSYPAPPAGTEAPQVGPPGPAVPPVPPPVPPAISSAACAGTVVYVQIYGPAMREQVREWRWRWRELGASVPPTEDLISTSQRQGRSPPRGHPVPTMVIQADSARACTDLLQLTAPLPNGQAWTVIKLPPSLKSTPGAIEVWLPRSKDATY